MGGKREKQNEQEGREGEIVTGVRIDRGENGRVECPKGYVKKTSNPEPHYHHPLAF